MLTTKKERSIARNTRSKRNERNKTNDININVNVIAKKLVDENKKNNNETIKNIPIIITTHGRRYTKKRILTTREIEYLTLASLGYRNRIIAGILFVSSSTVKKTLEKVFDKLNARDRANATAIGFMYNVLNKEVLNEMQIRADKYMEEKEKEEREKEERERQRKAEEEKKKEEEENKGRKRN